MSTDTIQPLNYTPEAIAQLKVMEQGLRSNAPYTSYVMRQVIDMLHDSVKFILPNCCDIIEPEEYRQAHLDLARLPYPVVTFEIPWVKDEPVPEVEGFPTLPSTKRIALCWESKEGFEPVPGCNQILQGYPEGGVFVLPIAYSDSIDQWILGIGGVFFPHDNVACKADLDGMLPAANMAMKALHEAGMMKTNSIQFRAEPFVSCIDMKDDLIRQAGSIDKLYAQIIMDSRDELQAFIQACSVLNCENVKPVTLSRKPEKKFVNGRRVKPVDKKLLPAYTYKVLQLSEEKFAATGTGEGVKGGTKRMHLRRGHIRRRNDKLHWVRASMVNAHSSTGVIEKDYAIRVKAK